MPTSEVWITNILVLLSTESYKDEVACSGMIFLHSFIKICQLDRN